MKLKKNVVVPVAIVLVLAAAFIYVACGTDLFENFYLANFATEEYSKQYEKQWKSTDGKITFVMKSKKQMCGIATICEGSYDNGNEKKEIEIIIDGYSKATVGELCLFEGKSDYNYFTSIYTVMVESSDTSISPYKTGDTIFFYKVD